MYSGDKRIKYEKETPDTLFFEFDKDQMLQVLHNLLQNAQDAINNQSAGMIKIKPPKSEPCASGIIPQASATPAPPLEPLQEQHQPRHSTDQP